MLQFQGPPHDVQCLAFVPGKDGNSIAAGYWGHLFIWPLSGGEPESFSVGPDDQLFGTTGLAEIAVSPDGKGIAGRWYRGTRLWRRQRDKWIDLGIAESAAGVAFRGSDLYLVTGQSPAAGAWTYRITRGRANDKNGFRMRRTLSTAPHPEGMVTAGDGVIALGPEAQLLATSAREKAVQLWNVRTGKHRGTIDQRGFVEELAWSPDGQTFAVNAGVTVRLYDVASLTERLAWKVKYTRQPRMAFSPDGRLLATTDASAGVHLWDVAGGRLQTTLKSGRTRRVPIAFAPDGLTFAAGGMDGSVVVWDL
jgi:WD40 repeat protein